MGKRQCTIVVSSIISLMISDVDHLFHVLIGYLCIFSRNLTALHILNLGLFYYWLLGVPSLFSEY